MKHTPTRLIAAALVSASMNALMFMVPAHAQTPPTATQAARPETPRPLVQDTMAQRMQACSICHGAEGRATNQGYFPRIAGKPPGYLYNQLLNFREGRRHNAAMAYLVEHMSDAYLLDIGRYFGALELPYPAPQPSPASAETRQRGEHLVRHGDAARGIPACVQCHGDRMTGVLPAFPGLLGLPRDYLMAQFGAWRAQQRKAVQPDCMHTIATRLTPDEVGAVASWLAAQPLPADTHPAPRLNGPLPMPCGSGER